MIQYLPGLFGLGTMDRGEVWKGLRMSSTYCCVNGPSYLPLLNSCAIDCWKMSLCTEILSLLEGVNIWATYLTAALKPYCKLIGMCLYLLGKLLASSRVCHSMAWYGVLILNFGLCKSACLGSVVVATAAGAAVP
jgi:hypothetical protein